MRLVPYHLFVVDLLTIYLLNCDGQLNDRVTREILLSF